MMIRYIIELDQNLFIRLNNMGSEEFDFIWLFFSNKITMILFVLMFTLLLCYKYAQQKTIMICFFLLMRFLISLENFFNQSFFGFPFSLIKIEDPILITIFLNLLICITNQFFF